MLSDVKEKIDLQVTNNGDHDKDQHYFDREDIEANILEGKPMIALCGIVRESQVDPQGRTVCPACKEIYEAIKARDEAS